MASLIKLRDSGLLRGELARNMLRVSELSETIRRARETKGMSQKGLADLSGVSEGMIYRVEKGDNTSIDTVLKLADVLGLREIPLTGSTSLLREAPALSFGQTGGLHVVEASPRMRGMSVDAYVSAGPGGWDGETHSEMIEVPEFLVGSGDLVVQARGESMVEEGIEDGDYILVERRSTGIAAHGELVIAWLNDGLVIKRWYRRAGKKFLESANAAMGWKPREITADDVFEIQAVVKYILKKAKRIS